MSNIVSNVGAQGLPLVGTLLTNVFGLVNSVTTAVPVAGLVSGLATGTDKALPLGPSVISAVLTEPMTLVGASTFNSLVGFVSSLDQVTPAIAALTNGQMPTVVIPVVGIQVPFI